MSQLGQLRFGPRKHECLARENQRRKYHYAPTQAENAEAGDYQHFQEQAKQAAQEQQHFEPASRAVQEVAPEVQQKRQRRDESTDARAWRVQLDVNADEANHQKQNRQRWRGQRLDQFEGPIGLSRADVAGETV